MRFKNASGGLIAHWGEREGSVRPWSGEEDSDSESMDFCRGCLDLPVGTYSGALEDSDDEGELGTPPRDLGKYVRGWDLLLKRTS